MTRFLIFFISLVSLTGARAYSLLPLRYEGTMMPYDFALEEAPAWPDSLRPVYCAYVARHGARYMTGPKKFDKLEPVLRREAEAGNLTADGRALLAMVDSVRTLSEGKWGQLSAVGIHEQKLLGAEMTRLVPELGRDDAEVATLSSFVPRAMMTMYEFNHAMMLRNDRLDVTACSGHTYSPLVYFFDTDSVYRAYRKDGTWKEITDRYQAENIPVAPLRRLFVRPVNIKKHKQQELVMDIYSLLQSRRAMGLPAPSDRFMSAAEYGQCWMLSNLSHYLRNCQSPLSGDIVPRSVATLVEYIIGDADRSLGDPVMRNGFSGYFGHAETLMPLLSALRIPGCHAMTTDAAQLAKQWKSDQVVPLGANLGIFLFRTGRGVLAAVRLNGRNVKPIPGKGYLVDWSELKSYWRRLVPYTVISE